MSNEIQWVCDCKTKDSLVCKEHPDCRPSYCKMRLLDSPIVVADTMQHMIHETLKLFLDNLEKAAEFNRGHATFSVERYAAVCDVAFALERAIRNKRPARGPNRLDAAG